MDIRTLAVLCAATMMGALTGCGGSGAPPDVDAPPGPLAAPPVLLSVNVVGAPDVQVSNFVLTGTTRISRTVFEYTYRADATNGDTIAVALTASLASSAVSTTVMDGALDFGNVSQGATKTSLDTFTIRQDRTVPFDGNALTWTAETAPASAAGLLLEEVLYAPAAGAAPFIDLVNAGIDSVPLQSLILKVDDIPIRLEDAATELTSGARLHILLDGQSRADGLTYHAAPEVVVTADAGTIALLDKFGEAIDQVAWGTAAGAVNVVASGILFDQVEAGTTIGRASGMTNARDRDAWVGYPPDQATPAAANPFPVVRGLHPLSGAILARAGTSLSWFPVPGAVRYRVQVAAEPGFSAPLLDVVVEDAEVDVAALAAGSYLWRVQSEFAGGGTAGFSEAYRIQLTDGTSALAALSSARVRIQAAMGGTAKPAAAMQTKLLPVPLIDQHKDTRMLLLEESHPNDDPFSLPQPDWDPALEHLWDGNHGRLREKDPADNANCLLASLAMMNHYFGGDLNQDRIGYEIHKDRQPGPEWDLNLAPVPPARVNAAYSFALGRLAPNWEPPGNPEGLWTVATSLIDLDIPVLAVRTTPPAHAFVIVGYDNVNGHRYLVVNDPWHARQIVYDVADPAVATWAYAAANGFFQGVRQEASVTTDSDGDGIVDFDETERFHTDPNLTDSDLDGVHDYYDIYASVFDPSKGYHYGPFGDRDDDGDSLPMERDRDSDAGGCEDGQEDKDGNGKYAGMGTTETWNFDTKDDSCLGLAGHLVYHDHQTGWITPDVWRSFADTTVISVRLAPDPGTPGDYIDDGSTFVFRGAHEAVYDLGQCAIWANSAANQAGDFTGPGAGLVQGSIVPDGSGRIGLHFVTGIDPQNTQGWGGGCGLPAASGQAGDSYSAEFRDECWGDPVPGAPPGHQTYNFSCQTTDWTASGSLTVVAPP